MKDENHKKLGEVEKRLYSRDFEVNSTTLNQFEKKDLKQREKWEELNEIDEMKKSKKVPMIKKVLISSVLFFIVAFSFAAFNFSNDGNVVSISDVDLVLTGPVSVNGGEQFDVDVDVFNNSGVIIESANLFIEYPIGAYSSSDLQKELTREKVEIGFITSLQGVKKTFPVVFFGEENTEKEITVTLELRFQDSSATLEKTEIYTIRIASSPVNLSLSVPKETNLNQEFEIVIDLGSNSNEIISGIITKVDYPFGFVFKSAVPSPSADDNVWDIGDIAPSSNRTIKIRGVLDGQEGYEKEFNVSVGAKNNKDINTIGTIYNSVSEITSITEPFIGVSILVNGSDEHEYISSAEEIVRVDVLWESNIDTRIVDGRIEVKLDGSILDKFSVSVGAGGFYRSIDNTIIWDKARDINLSILEPRESGSVSFSLKSLPLISDTSVVFSNPQITIKAIASGKRISDLNVPEEVSSFVDKKIKIESGLSLSSRVVYYAGPFKNTGFMPPKAEIETTYTVIWTITNSSNKITAAAVNMVLPPYVRWLGVVSGEEESISFNEAGGEIVWNVGSVPKGAGISSASRELAFQIGFLPSISQIGTMPLLIGATSISGEDSFTGTIIKDKIRALSTRLFADPRFSESEAQVIF